MCHFSPVVKKCLRLLAMKETGFLFGVKVLPRFQVSIVVFERGGESGE